MSAGKVQIVGIGDDGVEGMTAQARRLVEDAEVLVGPDSCGVVLPGPLRDRLPRRPFGGWSGALSDLPRCPLGRLRAPSLGPLMAGDGLREGAMAVTWQGVFPAATTQFDSRFRLDLEATGRVFEALIRDGVDGLIVCGTVGENCSLGADEKREVMRLGHAVARGRVPVISGVAEYTTELACTYARDAAKIGIDGLMAMPAMVYSAKPHEIVAHFRAVARASDLPRPWSRN